MKRVEPVVGFAVPTAVLPVGYARIDGEGHVTDAAGFMRRIAADMAANGLAGVTDPQVFQAVAAAGFVELLRIFDPWHGGAVESLCFPDTQPDRGAWPAEQVGQLVRVAMSFTPAGA